MARQLLKLFHIDADEVIKLIDWMKLIYQIQMNESRGKKHDYLGMDLDFSVDE